MRSFLCGFDVDADCMTGTPRLNGMTPIQCGQPSQMVAFTALLAVQHSGRWRFVSSAQR